MGIGTTGAGASPELDLLDAGGELPFVTVEALPLVARTLAAAGWVVVVGCAGGGERLVIRGVSRRLRGSDSSEGDDTDAERSEVPAGATRAADGFGAYEDELSERRSRGALSLSSGAWWTAALSVPVERGEPLAYIQLERHAGGDERDGDGDREGAHADFVVPASEVDAVLALLRGVAAQARRDGVLPPPFSGAAPSSPTGGAPG